MSKDLTGIDTREYRELMKKTEDAQTVDELKQIIYEILFCLLQED
jgi:hypothetical protein